ncbi:hypothetical protein DMENIID0001_096650 [Sergentomyia squamirostris]
MRNLVCGPRCHPASLSSHLTPPSYVPNNSGSIGTRCERALGTKVYSQLNRLVNLNSASVWWPWEGPNADTPDTARKTKRSSSSSALWERDNAPKAREL